MSPQRRFNRLLALLAGVSMCVPWHAASAATITAPQVSDVALAAGNTLTGQAYTSTGRPAAGETVTLLAGTDVVATAMVDQTGHFHIPAIRGGTYQLNAVGTTQVIRAWAPETAPPIAQQRASTVSVAGTLWASEMPLFAGTPAGPATPDTRTAIDQCCAGCAHIPAWLPPVLLRRLPSRWP